VQSETLISQGNIDRNAGVPMNHNNSITDENAEFIGKPIFEKIIQSHEKGDHKKLIQCFPELQNKITQDIFEEAVGNLKPLGKVLSKHYLTHSLKNDNHLIVWKVKYSRDDEDVLWNLHLSDDEKEIKVMGFGFNR